MSNVLRMRLERLADKRDQLQGEIQQEIEQVETGNRMLSPSEEQRLTRKRDELKEIEKELIPLADDIQRLDRSNSVSRLLHADAHDSSGFEDGHRTFAEYATDQMVVRDRRVAEVVAGNRGSVTAVQEEAQERLYRTLQNTTSTTVAGLIVPTHMAEILDIINKDRPVAASGRQVPLDRGSMTYPKIDTRPTVVLQSSEKSEAGTVAPAISQGTLSAQTYLGATNVSWQAANWSNPDIIQLYFELAAEAYARQTEDVACEALETSAIGTVGTASGRLGTAGTESFAQWRAAVAAGIAGIYSATGGRMRTNTLYLSPDRFFALATLGTDQVAQISPVGSLDVGSMTGNFFGLNVIGSRGFDANTAIVGDSDALLVGENPGNPVEMKVIEPRIGGYECGLIGAMAAVVFDPNRFFHLGVHS